MYTCIINNNQLLKKGFFILSLHLKFHDINHLKHSTLLLCFLLV